jgi:hypothetical protein
MYWDIENPYIGQTVSLPKRKRAHFNAMSRGDHDNYKIQQKYNYTSILPNIDILQNCNIEQLNSLEEFYIKDFDSINTGLNIISGGYSVGYGTNNPASVYTEAQLVEVLKLLSDVKNSYEYITEKTNVLKDTITKIVSGIQHVWLQEKYPDLYSAMKSIDSKLRYSYSACASGQGKRYKKIMSPDGTIYDVLNTLQFSKEHNLPNGNLCSVLLGKRKTVKGWKGLD